MAFLAGAAIPEVLTAIGGEAAAAGGAAAAEGGAAAAEGGSAMSRAGKLAKSMPMPQNPGKESRTQNFSQGQTQGPDVFSLATRS